MTATVAQLVSSLTGGVTLTVSAGSTLHVMGVGFFTSYSGVTCSDNQGGGTSAYGSPLDAQVFGGNSCFTFRKNNLSAGSVTVTLGNIPGGGGTGMLAVLEITGVGVSPNDAHTSNFQTDPGGGGTATSGNLTPSTQPALVVAFCTGSNLGFDGTDASAVGAGWTDVGTCLKCFGSNDAFRVSSKRITSTSAIAATFTWSGFGNDAITFAALYNEAVVSSIVTFQSTPFID